MSSEPPDKSFAALFEEASRGAPRRRKPQVGETFDVAVVQVGKEAVFVEFNGHEQGFVDATDLCSADGALKVAVGDALYARIVEIDGEQGIRLIPTHQSAAAAGAAVSVGGGGTAEPVRVALGQVVSGAVHRVEPYGVFVQIDGTKGRAGRGLVPTAELGTARGADLRKAFPLGAKLKAKVLDVAEGKMRLSVRAMKEDEERAIAEGFRQQDNAAAARGFGTLGDLLKGRKDG